jgi:rhodanese-related sulfurtransferase
VKRLLRETVLVGLAAGLLALAANALSPRGLHLTRNYFPNQPPPATNGSGPVVASTNPPATTTDSPDATLQRLLAKGLQVAAHETVTNWFADPKREQRLFLFVDARNEKAFAEGHIPSAVLLDYYRPEPYLPTVLPAVLAAEKVIIYCNGGECEDSELTAQFLKSAGVSGDKLFVYAGGIAEWKRHGLPVQEGMP